ncbi:MAG: AAA family ATPase [Pseudolysinimonas sp.]
MLSAADRLDPPPQRILVAGVSGSGKTTLARRISAATGIPHTEIDSLRHGPNWMPRDDFAADVERFTRADSWITEWQYRELRPLLAERADLLIWIDLPVALTMSRVIRRTLRRRLRREVLWNGNVESPLLTFLTERDHIIRWAWRTRNSWRNHVAETAAAHPELRIMRLTHRRQVDALVTATVRWRTPPR